MAVTGSLQVPHGLGISNKRNCDRRVRPVSGNGNLHLLRTGLTLEPEILLVLGSYGVGDLGSSDLQPLDSNHYKRQGFLKEVFNHSNQHNALRIPRSGGQYRPIFPSPRRYDMFKCHSVLNPGKTSGISCMKNIAIALTRSSTVFQSNPIVLKLVSAVGIIVFTIWGLGPVLRQSRNIFFRKSDSSWKKSGTHYVLTSYLQPLLLWTGVILICRGFDPVVLPSEASRIVKQRILNFIRSLSTVLALAYCLSSVIQQGQKFFMEMNDTTDPRHMGFQFAGKAIYTAVWVAAISLFMELLGFSTQKWLTAGGLGTVLLTLAGREIFTNFLSSAMIHATRPFIVNEWIQTKIEGYEVSGTVEHVGWWSPTIVRGEDREAVHIPNHKFTVNVVRNLSQKTHWRIKTHLAISHLDVNKINNIVADMRKVLAKNPNVEHKRLHRRVFLDNVNPENQALLILISCFVKTSHFEEYLCVKEAILLDLLRVISHHRARLATPMRTIQKIYSDSDIESMPFSDSIFSRGAASTRRLLMIEPPYKVNGEEKSKPQAKPARSNGDQDNKNSTKPAPEGKTESKAATTVAPDLKAKEPPSPPDVKEGDLKVAEMQDDSLKPNSPPKPASKAGTETPSSQLKHENERPPPASRSPLEENIVLGVALEGSKRTLPIEEEEIVVPTEAKELAKCGNGSGSTGSDKAKTNHSNNVPKATTSTEQREQAS